MTEQPQQDNPDIEKRWDQLLAESQDTLAQWAQEAIDQDDQRTIHVDLRLPTKLFQAIQTLAERRGIPCQRLIQTWLNEKLAQEAPDLVPQH